jgi:CHAT domain-containing protein
MAVLGSDRDTVATVLDPMSRQQLGWLYDDLLRPIEHWLEGINRLIIAPDGVLFQVPFHALYSGTHALGEKHEIAYAPSASALRLCRENLNRRSEAQGPVVVMGNTEIEALPHIQRELDAIAAAVPDAVLLTDDQATLAHLQKHAPQSRGLHIASHADFRTDNPFFSALQLAKGEQLRVLELYTLPLQGTLVTLSACETGKHRLRGGDLLGLSRGFFCAGASTLLVSLWPVADVSTTLLMAQFYTLMEKGKTAATALREAQHYLAHFEEEQDGRKIQPYAHPYYWAPFCLLGAPDMRWV